MLLYYELLSSIQKDKAFLISTNFIVSLCPVIICGTGFKSVKISPDQIFPFLQKIFITS